MQLLRRLTQAAAGGDRSEVVGKREKDPRPAPVRIFAKGKCIISDGLQHLKVFTMSLTITTAR